MLLVQWLKPILVCEDVVKEYNGVRALDRVAFRVEEGEVVGLVGPNGAGKTTLLKVSLGILRRESGRVELLGRDPLRDPEAREKVGVVFERPNLPSAVPVHRILSYAASIKGASRDEVRRAIKLAGLEGHEWKPFTSLSAGLKQRAAIAHALVGSPSFIIADEPTSNLDPVERIRILNLIGELNRDHGITFLVSSHILPEVVRIASKIVIMNRGKVVKSGSPEEVLGGLTRARIRGSDVKTLAEVIREHGFDVKVQGFSVLVKIPGLSHQPALLEALTDAGRRGVVIYSVDFVEASIEAELMKGG